VGNFLVQEGLFSSGRVFLVWEGEECPRQG